MSRTNICKGILIIGIISIVLEQSHGISVTFGSGRSSVSIGGRGGNGSAGFIQPPLNPAFYGPRCNNPCTPGQACCSGVCVYLRFGQSCDSVPPPRCGFGEERCGQRCHRPSLSSKCFPNGVICGFGEEACGYQCHQPSLSSKCFPNNGIVCGFGEEACGYQCYRPSITSFGRKCVNNVLV